MSGQPIRPLGLPATRQPSTYSPNTLGQSTAETSSASSSTVAIGQPQPNRSDQVLYRFYLKTVAVLAEGRVTHIGSSKGDKKKGKWFNLTIPDFELYQGDLQIYRSISSYSQGSTNSSGVPPLLIAFILDTSDLPNGQALIWNRNGARVTIDTSLFGGKGKGKEQRTGIVLERWTLRASPMAAHDVSASQMAAHTAYRLGIIHFRALFALTRLLPSYRLYRRLRRANSGLRLGIKLWGTEGYSNTPEDLAAAWEVMERGLIPLDSGLDQYVANEAVPPDTIDEYHVPSMNLFGTTYSVGVDYRSEVDFTVEDKESVLSEKFVDMDEDWFTPTVARHRMEGEAKSAEPKPIRKTSNPSGIPMSSPIPQRQQAAAPGSFGSLGTGSRPSQSRLASGVGVGSSRGVSQGSGRWGTLAENMPFAAPSASHDTKDSSPNNAPIRGGAAVAARRLSGHSVNMSSSPSTSLLRSTPPVHSGTPITGPRPGTSIGRTSSFLSQSGRSFTHAQLANMSPPIAAVSPAQSPISPSSLSFSKQPVARSLSSRATYIPPSGSSPIIPGSLEQDSPPAHGASAVTVQPGSGGSGPQIIKRYSSSFSRQNRLVGSQGSGEGSFGAVTPGSGGHGGMGSQSLLRRTSTRTSQESGLRYSATPSADDDDIQAFLKGLDTLPQPPSLAAQAVQASRSHMPSTSSSLSNQSIQASPSPLHASNNSPNSQTDRPPSRAPMTKAQVDDQLKKMVGSFNVNTNKMVDSTGIGEVRPSRQPTPSTSGSGSNVPSVGLLTASRPASSPRGLSQPGTPPRPGYLRQASLKAGSPLASSPLHVPLPESPAVEPRRSAKQPAARSLPGSASITLGDDTSLPRTTTAPTSTISPQTTGTSSTTNESRTSSNRRGPVLLRGGFESRATKPSSSPSHSPIRDYARMGGLASRSAGLGNRGESISLGYGRKAPGQRTAPSSFGVRDGESGGNGANGIGGDEESARLDKRGRREERRSEGGGSSIAQEERNEQLRQGMMRDW